ncbi:protein-glutamine gamma-glutamyltransferase [Paenibacillus ehimensis]|uniref:Protein-glutamine gamma-glutamyltransferase n=1 Tax=Paenibacillus ehimensis TaxID=79264 RepID=A0ABT8V9U1_9BACL|nr:protein-glutamine gamma-glutamyltransferase [Paenibacillus ehimensis]MDO3677436.1 protein-glutamine gamma-glutamyltransferase [Paenibacillus ehimensis]MEC0212488.1 protein-glutamine gamma-glutamyltransferase [Paenibacillus ehimensis]
MIVIADGQTSVDISGWEPPERDIYEEKHRNPTTYQYDSEGALRFELRLRTAIVQAARDMQNSAASFASFKKSRCNAAYWTRTEDGGFKMRRDVLPAAAIRDIFSNGRAYAFECATAIIIVLYKAVLETIGDQKFNRLFTDLYLYSWEVDSDLRLITIAEKMPTYSGDILYFKNPDVDPEWMEWQGENVVKLGHDNYFGHGIGIMNAAGIIAKLNKHRKPGSTRSAYLMDQVTYPNFVYLYEAASSRFPISQAALAWLPPEAFGRIVVKIGGRTNIYA